MLLISTVASLPPAAMNCHQGRRLGVAFRQVEVADQRGPVVLGVA